tara:strand:+ start:981 stop:1151 length:171 start_codon:yes stop_codon:yes gene_type:complete
MTPQEIKLEHKPLCTICKSPLLLRDAWVNIGTHKDCLDEELKKVRIETKPMESADE